MIYIHKVLKLGNHGPVVGKCVKFNPGLGKTLSKIILHRNTFGFSKILLKYTTTKPSYVHPINL